MVSILGVPFHNMTEHQVVEKCMQYMNGSEPRIVITAGPEFVMRTSRQPELLQLFQEADLVTPDGIGIVIAAKWYGCPMRERVTGVELSLRLLEHAAKTGLRVFLLGASANSLEGAITQLKRDFPSLHIAGRNGYFTSGEIPAVLEEISGFQPHLLLVGLGQPRQDLFISEHRSTLSVPLSIGIGGTIDVISGAVKRAPRFMQRARLEWLYRLLREPQRFKRQLVLPQFALKAWLDAHK